MCLPTASLGMALASLVEAKGASLENATVMMYSYGSGLAAGMFVLRGRSGTAEFNLPLLQSKVRSQPVAVLSHHVLVLSMYKYHTVLPNVL